MCFRTTKGDLFHRIKCYACSYYLFTIVIIVFLFCKYSRIFGVYSHRIARQFIATVAAVYSDDVICYETLRYEAKLIFP